MQGSAFCVFLDSIGCRTNQEEISAIGRKLAARGHRIVNSVSEADIVVLNTCSVTSHTESKTRRYISSLARRAPGARILVTGCLVQQDPEKFKSETNISWIVGNAHKAEILSIIENGVPAFYHSPVNLIKSLPVDGAEGISLSAGQRTRFSVKIQEGCDSSCTYCIVPSLRGVSRCADKSQVLDACKSAVAAGYKEIVLTGTHIGQYHSGEPGGLAGLIKGIFSHCKGDFRIRLSSLNPGDLTEPLAEIIRTESRICDHLHLSVQSLCPDILREMNRSADELEKCLGRVSGIRQKRPNMGLGADIIVGFPGETGPMFQMTLDRYGQTGFSYAHIFRYSKRPGTSACLMENQVSESEKISRSNRLREEVARNRNEFIRKQFNVNHRILVEEEFPASGYSSNYLRLEIPGFKAKTNSWLDAKLEKYDQKLNMCIGIVNPKN